MWFLKYNLAWDNVEGICNIYLQHHPIKVNIKVAQILCTTTSQPPLIMTPNWWGDKWAKNALQN
jgi:hypothetical protein